MVNTRRDAHGRLLAPSRVNPRAEVVVASPSGEQLPEGRMAALGVDPDAPARKPRSRAAASRKPADTSSQQGDDDQAGDQQSEGTESYPIATGAGWYELSNGEKVQGENAAIERQTELDEAAKQEG